MAEKSAEVSPKADSVERMPSNDNDRYRGASNQQAAVAKGDHRQAIHDMIQMVMYGMAVKKASKNDLMELYSKKFVLPGRPGFHQVFEGGDARSHQIEYVHETEDSSRWTEMITLQGLKGMGSANGMNLAKFMRRFVALTARSCRTRKDFAWDDLGLHRLLGYDDSYLARVFISGCKETGFTGNPAAPSGVSEMALYLLIDGGEDYFLSFYSIRGKAGSIPFNSGNFVSYLKAIVPVRFCDSTVPDQTCIDYPLAWKKSSVVNDRFPNLLTPALSLEGEAIIKDTRQG